MKKYEHNTISVFHLKKRAVIIRGSKTAGTKKPGRLLKEGKIYGKKASLVGRLLSENQMSEAFINSMFLALSGGFQDAYTYNCRDEVFSNAQTGNVVLMSQNFLEGNFTAGLRYLFPILFLRWVYFWQKISRSITGMQRGCTGGRYFSRRKL